MSAEPVLRFLRGYRRRAGRLLHMRCAKDASYYPSSQFCTKEHLCECSQDVVVLLPSLLLSSLVLFLVYVTSVDVLCPGHCLRYCSGSLQFVNPREAAGDPFIRPFVGFFFFLFIIHLVFFPLLPFYVRCSTEDKSASKALSFIGPPTNYPTYL